ncbi:hypothetical protein LV457_18765 [Mycobacterium sp. MYCO198283]|uniref:hypothetical protein n=1 Tax=Mycobacterium sp. MYCO198283 TaxID=2883505 RepID=UPI001E348AFE|nr:hypothetical protein [Mycobacterium sp. MYCO198283]MCG5434317.1 hypothetical protein [Mycobacterium sp. MYCO198283]
MSRVRGALRTARTVEQRVVKVQRRIWFLQAGLWLLLAATIVGAATLVGLRVLRSPGPQPASAAGPQSRPASANGSQPQPSAGP